MKYIFSGFSEKSSAEERTSSPEEKKSTGEEKMSSFIRVVIDRATGENAALVTHGWPPGVNLALIVILAADGMTEVYRQLTTHLHNEIQMPDGSRGKQFIIKAAFLRHVDDAPKFGLEPTFSMPLSTEDLAKR